MTWTTQCLLHYLGPRLQTTKPWSAGRSRSISLRSSSIIPPVSSDRSAGVPQYDGPGCKSASDGSACVRENGPALPAGDPRSCAHLFHHRSLYVRFQAVADSSPAYVRRIRASAAASEALNLDFVGTACRLRPFVIVSLTLTCQGHLGHQQHARVGLYLMCLAGDADISHGVVTAPRRLKLAALLWVEPSA